MKNLLGIIAAFGLTWGVLTFAFFGRAQMVAPGMAHHLMGNPSATSGGWTPTEIPGLRYWWVHSDLGTNVPVTNWVDKIQSSVWTNAATATKPTNTASGVYFNGAQNLTNSGVVYINGANYASTHFIILQPTATPPFSDILDYAETGDQQWTRYSSIWRIVTGSSARASFGDPAGAFDMVLVNTNGSMIAFTNGVPSNTNAMAINLPWRILGGFSGEFFTGYVREFLVWTNTLTHAQVAQLHNYATNKYSYTP